MQIADIQNNSTVLVGTYRTEKAQQDWILGIHPMRQEILYNVRFNQDIFAARNGGITLLSKPDFVLLYDYHDLKKTGHLFECLSLSVVTEDEMRFMQYPEPNGSYVVYRLGEEVDSDFIDIEAIINGQIVREPNHIVGAPFLISIEDVRRLTKPEAIIKLSATCEKRDVIRFIDLFAGIGGIRCGLEQAIRECGFEPVCVFTSEIKPYAVRVLHDNHPAETITGDITKVETKDIPDFDILCAGFPCQAFSSAGKRKGFADTRGTMFFEVERILRDKQPLGFILENVEGLVNHDGGRTLQVIVDHLNALNYQFSYRVLNSRFFGVPQERKRIYIVGTRKDAPNLDNFPIVQSTLADVLEEGLPTEHSPFIDNLLAHYAVEE